MLFDSFEELYFLLRANYYQRVAAEVGTRQGSLSATECFCLEIIFLMKRPTISQFAQFVGLSLPSANYRIGSLVEKGYLEKTVSETDKRESILTVTDKYRDFYGANNPVVGRMIQGIEDDFGPEELANLISMIDRIIIILRQAQQTGEETE